MDRADAAYSQYTANFMMKNNRFLLKSAARCAMLRLVLLVCTCSLATYLFCRAIPLPFGSRLNAGGRRARWPPVAAATWALARIDWHPLRLRTTIHAFLVCPACKDLVFSPAIDARPVPKRRNCGFNNRVAFRHQKRRCDANSGLARKEYAMRVGSQRSALKLSASGSCR
jgi:hypothetical protein